MNLPSRYSIRIFALGFMVGVLVSVLTILAAVAHGQQPPIQWLDGDLWQHVYNPRRLLILKAQATVTGTIVDATAGKRKDGLRHEADGDCHGWLRLDAGQEHFLNSGNMGEEKGNMVFEVVCMFPVRQKDAVSACKGYKNLILVPPVGSHVKMTGSWVKDTNHAQWNEIHPVSSIELTPK